LFWQQVAGEALDIHSLTRAFADFDPSTVPALTLRWNAPGPGVVHLHARGYALDPYYAMDARQPAEKGRYDWPTSVLAQLRYRRSDIGIMASMRANVGNVQHTVYLPLLVGEAVDSGSQASYELVFRAVATVTRATTTVSRLGPNGSIGAPMETKFEGRWMAEQPARLRFIVNGDSGYYRMDLSAIGADNRAFTAPSLVFYHAAVGTNAR
jgi:hypothetical protein